MDRTFPQGGVLQAMNEEPVTFVMVDSDGLIRAVNKAFRDFFGWSGSSVIGSTLDIVLPEAFRMSHHLAFSTFDSPENSKVVGHPLKLIAKALVRLSILGPWYYAWYCAWCAGKFKNARSAEAQRNGASSAWASACVAAVVFMVADTIIWAA